MYFFTFIVAPSWYLIKIMIAQSLTIEEIWLFYSILGMITIISAYNDLWLTEALQYYLPKYLIKKEYDNAKSIRIYTLLSQIISSIIIWSLLYFWAERLSDNYFRSELAYNILRIFSFYFLLINLLQAIQSFFISTQKVKRYHGLDALRMWLIVTWIGIALWSDSLTLFSFTCIWLIALFITLIVWYINIQRIFHSIIHKASVIRNWTLFQQQWKYGTRVMIGAGTGTLLWQINQQFALYYLWSDAAAYWAYYLSFYTIIGVVTNPIIWYLFPLLNELYIKKAENKIKYLFKLLFIGVIGFWIIWGFGSYFLAEPIAILLFWESFRQSGILFQHYAPFVFTIPLLWIFFQDIASRGMVKERVGILTVWLIANGVASFILGNQFWLTGLVYAQLIGNTILILWWWWYFKKK